MRCKSCNTTVDMAGEGQYYCPNCHHFLTEADLLPEPEQPPQPAAPPAQEPTPTPQGQPPYGQQPYNPQQGQPPYGQQPYNPQQGQPPYGQQPYNPQQGQPPYGQQPYNPQQGQPPYGQQPYNPQQGQPPYGQQPYYQGNPYYQQPAEQQKPPTVMLVFCILGMLLGFCFQPLSLAGIVCGIAGANSAHKLKKTGYLVFFVIAAVFCAIWLMLDLLFSVTSLVDRY